jgi:hypothetical protein
VRRRLELSQRFDEAVRVVRFVAADGDPSLPQTRDESGRGIAFARVPVAGTTQASTTRPWRFSISTSPR